MDRDELSRAIEAVKVLQLRATDKVVLKIKHALSREVREMVRSTASKAFDHDVIIIDEDIEVEILRPEP